MGKVATSEGWLHGILPSRSTTLPPKKIPGIFHLRAGHLKYQGFARREHGEMKGLLHILSRVKFLS